MRRENALFKTKFVSEAGSKLKNTDYFAYVELEDCACYCIADGIDKDKDKLSAELAVEEAIRKFFEKPVFSKRTLKRCMNAANDLLKLEARATRLEASITIVLSNYNTLLYGCAGNTRLYHIRNGAVKNKSEDLSLSRSLLDQGKLPQDKLEEHEERHNLYCYLGMQKYFDPFYSKKIKLEDGDTLVLCTKGIWETAGTAEILDSLEDAKEPNDVCDDIEELILNRKKKKMPSFTIACIFMDKVYKNPEKRKKLIKKLIIAAIPITIAIIAVIIVLYIMNKKNQSKIESMLELKQTGIEYIEEQNFTRAGEKFDEALKAVKSADIKANSKNAEEKEELDEYDKVAELVVDAEENMEKADYEQAIHFYELAQKQLKNIIDFDDTSKEYIEEQRILAYSYMEILSDIQTGDKMVSVENYAEAMEAYENALEIARDIYYLEGKEQATEGIENVKEIMSGLENDELIEEAESYVEKAEEALDSENNDRAIEYYEKAIDLYKQAGDKSTANDLKSKIEEIEDGVETEASDQLAGTAEANILAADQAMEDGKYSKAIDLYQAAIDNYTEAKKTDKIPAIQVKIELAQSKNTATIEQENQASKYIDTAKEYEELLDFDTAATLYKLAKDIYQELGMESQATYMDKMIAGIEEKKAAEEKKIESMYLSEDEEAADDDNDTSASTGKTE